MSGTFGSTTVNGPIEFNLGSLKINNNGTLTGATGSFSNVTSSGLIKGSSLNCGNITTSQDSIITSNGNLNMYGSINMYASTSNIFTLYSSGDPFYTAVASAGIVYDNMNISGVANFRQEMAFGFYFTIPPQLVIRVGKAETFYYISIPTSDYRIKENFRTPQNNVLERLCSINIFDYQHKRIKELFDNTNIEKMNYYSIGFFAHELQELFPEYEGLVYGNKDEVNQDGSMKIQQINSFIFSNILMKSIQEQNAEVKQLKLDLQEQNEKINQLILTVQALQAEVQELKSK